MSKQRKWLLRFAGSSKQDIQAGLPFSTNDYWEFADLSGRQIREDKRGHIDSDTPPILKRLGIETEDWRYLSQHILE